MVEEGDVKGLASPDRPPGRQIGIQVLVVKPRPGQDQGIDCQGRCDQAGLGDEGRPNLPEGGGGRACRSR
jgi:hypothetical protein